jgi:hypothetical protein
LYRSFFVVASCYLSKKLGQQPKNSLLLGTFRHPSEDRRCWQQLVRSNAAPAAAAAAVGGSFVVFATTAATTTPNAASALLLLHWRLLPSMLLMRRVREQSCRVVWRLRSVWMVWSVDYDTVPKFKCLRYSMVAIPEKNDLFERGGVWSTERPSFF